MTVTAELADGRRLEFPDGTDPAVIQRTVQQLVGAAKPAQQQPKTPVINAGALSDTLADIPQHARNAASGFMNLFRGAADWPVGAAQFASRFMPQGAADAMSDYMRFREQEWDRVTGTKPDETNPGRVAGGLIAALPAGGTAAATLPARMWQGAKTGGLLGLSMPVNPDEDYWGTKVVQTGAGLVAGGLFPPVVEGVTRAGGLLTNAVADKVRGAGNLVSGNTRPANVEAMLQVELRKNGVDWTRLPENIRQQLVNETRNALSSGGKLDPKSIQRLAYFQRIGVEPMRGQVTRDPVLFAREQNMSKMEVGRPIADRLNQQNQGFIGTLDKARTATKANAADAYEAGQGAIASLKAGDKASRAEITAAYDRARGALGGETDVPMPPIAQRLGNVIDEYGEENIPAAVANRLKAFGLLDGKQTRVFNIAEAEKFRKLVNNNMKSANPTQASAMRELMDSVEDAVAGIPLPEAKQAVGAYAQARGLAKDRFQTLERTPALADAIEKDLRPENFIESYVVRGGIDDVKNLFEKLTPEAKKEVQSGVIDWLRGKSVSGSGDAERFVQNQFAKAMKAIGDRKLQTIFDPEALSKLQALRRAGAYAQSAPIASGVNYSNTATTIADALDKATSLPAVRAMIGNPGNLIKGQVVVPGLLAAPAPVQPASPLLAPQMMDQLAPLLGARSAPIGGYVLPGLLTQPR